MKKRLIGLLLVMGMVVSVSAAVVAEPDDDLCPPILYRSIPIATTNGDPGGCDPPPILD